jgi:MFS family permease
MGDIITRENGFVAPTGLDWTLMQSALPLSIVFVFLGGSAAVLGPWQSRVGHRKSILYAAMSFGGGLAVGSLGIYLHVLPLLYLGYGALAGTGLGLAYTPCISALMQWFPDKKGTASGITIAGFGSGALLFTPLVQKLTKHFAKLPEYLGPAKDFAINIVDGNMYVDINGKAVQVVEAMAADVAKLSVKLPEGLYVVGSGSTGAAETLAVLAAGYFSVMFASSLALKTPHASFVPPVAAPSLKPLGADVGTAPVAPPKVVDVSMQEAIR